MIHSREELESASEEVLSKEFLVPLFRAMDFRDVFNFHGGALEQGKDIVMWKVGALGSRENYAVVVKAQKISGNAKTIAVVQTQIEQAIATDFPDVTSGAPQRPTRVIVASNKDISKEGLASLGPLLDKRGLTGRVEFLGCDRLWELAQDRLMPWLVSDSLRRVRLELLEADPDYQAEANVARDGVRYTITPKHQGAAPIVFNREPQFPDTEEGRRQRDAYAEFIRAGTPVSFDQPFLPLVDPPQLLKYLAAAPNQGPYELSMPPRPLAVPMVFRLEALLGARNVEIPYIHFTTVHGGLVKMKFTNETQPIPIRIELSFDPDAGLMQLNYTLRPKNLPLYWALIYNEFVSVIADGGALILEDLSTGGRFRLTPAPGQLEGPPPALLDLLRRARSIEARVNQPVVIPDFAELSDESFFGVALAERIMNGGELLEAKFGFTSTFMGPSAFLGDILRAHMGGGSRVQAGQPQYKVSILGSQIDLGSIEVDIEKALIHPEDVGLAEAALASGSAEGLVLRFVSAPGTGARIVFHKWLPEESEISSARSPARE